jgi:hydroxyacid-oxoacid transhydrogenase
MGSAQIFEVASSTVRFGVGATREIGPELADQGRRRILVVTDQYLRELPPVQVTLESLRSEGLSVFVFDGVRVEPTDQSMLQAIRFAQEIQPDAIVAVGGGSSIDTAKVANLHLCHPADFLDYVYPPVGKGVKVPGPLLPLIAVPTTAGTGSETTGVAIFDLESRHIKTALSDRRLKPSLAIVDPENTRTMPASAAAATGLDVLSHALESYTAVDFQKRPAPARPSLRTNYQGANPISDVWALESLRLVARSLVRAVEDPADDDARADMLLAAAYAGIGFGNAGVHLPHAMSYPVSGLVRDYRPVDYPVDYPLVPHGQSVILCAPAVFRFTGRSRPERHLEAARILGASTARSWDPDAGEVLAEQLVAMMKRLKVPNGLSAIGFTAADVPALVEGTRPQERITRLSPREADDDDLAKLFEQSLVAW